jgi:hypothetical protein
VRRIAFTCLHASPTLAPLTTDSTTPRAVAQVPLTTSDGKYDAEKRAALELWADAVDAIIRSCPAEIDGYHARLAPLNGGKIKIG